MSKPKRLVVFCGAGFSMGAGLPSMLSFSHAVRQCATLSRTQKEDFNKIQIACSSLTSLTGASSRNLEDIASLLSVLNLSCPDFVFSECEESRTPSQAQALVDRCIRHVFSPDNHGYHTNAGNLIAHSLNCDLTVVTTNYDMNVELAAASMSAKITPSDWVSKTCIHNPEKNSSSCCCLYHNQYADVADRSLYKLRLYKLHGSVNWHRSEGKAIVENRWTATERDDRGRVTKCRLGSPAGDGPSPDSRRLVPPSVIKADGLSDLAEEWQNASKAIAEADLLWFIGYSFPPTDTFMRYFLAGALYRNTSVRQIVILDPNALAIHERAAELFGSSELRGLVEAIPLKWEEFAHHLGTLIDGNWIPSTDDQLIKRIKNRLEGRAVLNGQLNSFPDEQTLPSSRGRLDRGRGLR